MPDVTPGTVIDGKYRVERIIGSGGMGYVASARHLQLDQLVALKFMRAGALDGEEAKTRFYREAKASVRLRSEHIARVLDVGLLPSGDPYMVMEYLEGQDLAAVARERNMLPLAEACDYVLQACEALAEAHSLGIVHRDIKLANLFLSRGPTGAPHLKVLDFGISKATPFGGPSGNLDLDMTSTAAMLGSPRFMSPEQMRDPRDVDGRSDVWSLGVILYRLTSGRAPFDSDTLGRLFSMVMHEVPPPVRSFAPFLPPQFEMAVMKCLVKEREHRTQNVAELAQSLVPFSSNPPQAQQIANKAAMVLRVPGAPHSGPISGAQMNAMASGQMNAMTSGQMNAMTSGQMNAMTAAQMSAMSTGPMSAMAAGQIPPSSVSVRRMQSGPPGSNETGDGWGGTNAVNQGRRRPAPSKSPLLATLALLSCALVVGGLAIRAKYMQQRDVQTAAVDQNGNQVGSNGGTASTATGMMNGAANATPPREADTIPTLTVDNLPKVDDPKSDAVQKGISSSGSSSGSSSADAKNDPRGAQKDPQKDSSGPRDIAPRNPKNWGAKTGGATAGAKPQSGSDSKPTKPPEDSAGGIPATRD